jgi:uracil-DNA glycosylase family 4
MSERDKIIEDLRLWAKQQKRRGVERVVLDAERLENASAKVRLAAAAPSTRPSATPDSDLLAALTERHPAWIGSELMELACEIDACRACTLGAGRMNSVPGTGNPHAKLVFVGEAPGAEEDKQGIPFVGRAGRLLDKILQAIDLERKDVQILNILKCRPPDNRNPAPDEIESCRPFLERQIDSIRPGILVALGLFAGQWLTGKKISLTKLRETGPFEYRGIPVYATYPPAALLRNPNWKRPAWEDYKIIRREYDKL